MANLNLHANCASCKRGDIKAPADVFVQGRIYAKGRMIPYRAYLCDEHLELMGEQENADNLEIMDVNLDRLTMEHTDHSFNTFSGLCEKHHNPTIRNPLLRRAYNEHMTAQGLPHRAYA